MNCHYGQERKATHKHKDEYGEYSLCCFCHVKRGFPADPNHLNCMKAQRRIADGSWKGIEKEHNRPKPPAPTPNEVARIKRALDMFDEWRPRMVGEVTEMQRAMIINMLLKMQETEHEFYGIEVK